MTWPTRNNQILFIMLSMTENINWHREIITQRTLIEIHLRFHGQKWLKADHEGED